MSGKISQNKVVYCFSAVEQATLTLFSQHPNVKDFYEIKDLNTEYPSMVHYVSRQKNKTGHSYIETHALVKFETIDLALLGVDVVVNLRQKREMLEQRNSAVLQSATEACRSENMINTHTKDGESKSLPLYCEITNQDLRKDLGGRSFEAAYFQQRLQSLDMVYVYKDDIKFQERLAHIVRAYNNFMFNHLRWMFDCLDIYVKETFFSDFTTAPVAFIVDDTLTDTYGLVSDDSEKKEGWIINWAIHEIAQNIVAYSISTHTTYEEVRNKLEAPENMAKIHALLPQQDAESIIQLLYRLHQLIPLNGVDGIETDRYTIQLFRALLDNDFFSLYNKQPFGVYLRHVIRHELDIIVKPLPIQGSEKEQMALGALKAESDRYLSYLKALLPMDKIIQGESGEFDYIDGVITSVSEKKLLQKHNDVLRLFNILQQEDVDVPERLKQFREKFNISKRTIASHRDNAGIRWLQNVSYILGTLGMGVVISYLRTGEFTLFSSKGSKFNHSVEHQLAQIASPPPRNL